MGSDVDVTARVGDFVDQLHDEVRRETIGRAIGTLPTYLVTGVLMLFLLAFGRRYVLGFLSLYDDLSRRQVARRVIFQAGRRGRVYILFTIVHPSSPVSCSVPCAGCSTSPLPSASVPPSAC